MSKKLDDLHEHIQKYLSAYRRAKGCNPPVIRLTKAQVEILKKEAPLLSTEVDGIPVETI